MSKKSIKLRLVQVSIRYTGEVVCGPTAQCLSNTEASSLLGIILLEGHASSFRLACWHRQQEDRRAAAQHV